MEKDFKNIIDKFKKLNNLGYIQGINNNLYNSAGLTLENYFDKKPDSLFFPDYEGIEIKCTQRFSRYNISLFSLSFDGPRIFESNYLLENYGKCDTIFENYNKLVVNLKTNQKVLVSDKYYFELKIDYDNKKIFIRIYDENMNFIEDSAFIFFDSLEQRLLIKLNKLALFYASKRKMNNSYFFRYYKLECYTIKNILAFIKCLERGEVKATLLLRFERSEENLGKNRNKNIQFSIRKDSVEKLFDKIYSYEN